MKHKFHALVAGHRDAIDKSFHDGGLSILDKIARAILKALKDGHKILLCGNGGSASDSQHIAAEFVGRFHRERRSLPAIALTTDTSILTAVANDYAYEKIFSRQIEGLGRRGDVLIAISTSGRSKNVLEAVKQAKAQGIFTVGFTGKAGGPLKKAVDLCFPAGSETTSHIQEVHITALQAVCEVVEEVFFGS